MLTLTCTSDTLLNSEKLTCKVQETILCVLRLVTIKLYPLYSIQQVIVCGYCIIAYFTPLLFNDF